VVKELNTRKSERTAESAAQPEKRAEHNRDGSAEAGEKRRVTGGRILKTIG
jgi:hypothetical protein